MTAALYTRLYATANRLLTQYGASAVLGSVSPGAYDPATGSSADMVYPYYVQAAVFDYGTDEVDGSLILRTDKKALIAPGAAVVPKPTDTFTWQGVVHRVVSCEIVSPAGVTVLYKAQVRAA